MTLFEYLIVLIAIVISLGIIRLLDGLPQALAPGRRDSIHAAWVVLVLWLHVQFWWVFWSYSEGVDWNYPRFLLALVAPLLLYSLVVTLIPRTADAVASWGAHFEAHHVRYFLLLAAWMTAVSAVNWLVGSQPFLTGLRAGHAG